MARSPFNTGLGDCIDIGTWWGGGAVTLADWGDDRAGQIHGPLVGDRRISYFSGLTAFEGQVVTPTLVGRRLRLNIVVGFVSAAFFAR